MTVQDHWQLYMLKSEEVIRLVNAAVQCICLIPTQLQQYGDESMLTGITVTRSAGCLAQ